MRFLKVIVPGNTQIALSNSHSDTFFIGNNSGSSLGTSSNVGVVGAVRAYCL